MSTESTTAEVLAVIVALADGEPVVLTVGDEPRLPAGPLLPSHRSLQTAVRAWVEQQTGAQLGFLEQLYTFADRDRGRGGGRTISVSYLGLTSEPDLTAPIGGWRTWYSLLPWEDRRAAAPAADPTAALTAWAGKDLARLQRVAVTFGFAGHSWQPDLALQRYELLWEAGLVPESPDDRRLLPGVPGARMTGDHRRVLATGLARLRAKIQYRPVVFELMPEEFTLGQLQACVEALAGRGVHTQNFRRLVEQQHLVEETGGRAGTGGRPARLYRFRREVLQERLVAGTKLPAVRAR